jgi:hypothetical protein
MSVRASNSLAGNRFQIGAARLAVIALLMFAWDRDARASPEDTTTTTSTLQQLFSPHAIEKPWSVLLFGGRLSSEPMDQVLLLSPDYEDTGFLGGAVAYEFYRNTLFSFELEGGAGAMFGDSNGPQVWGAAYARWHNFPWNDRLKTSVAVSTGLNYTFKRMAYEARSAAPDPNRKLLHYFSPEVTFALPQHPGTELVFRMHHRSSVYGLFDCRRCGSDTPTLGLRHRF